MILGQRATVKRSFTIPELHARPARIGTHRPGKQHKSLGSFRVRRPPASVRRALIGVNEGRLRIPPDRSKFRPVVACI
jgi:hypothetical protein